MREVIYTTGKRQHTPKYNYRIVVDYDRKTREVVICHESLEEDGTWLPTHSVGIQEGDLVRVLKNIKPRGK